MFGIFRTAEYRTEPKLNPDEFAVGDRVYKVIPFVQESDFPIDEKKLLARVESLGGNVDLSDMEYLQKHQEDIPDRLCVPGLCIFFPKLRQWYWNGRYDSYSFLCIKSAPGNSYVCINI